ncbi:MAG: MBL fold metallo-hydrolase [Spirochaetae bacterium HGW-Spirochaetae-1]|jgi:7,8-dihydropterin-6-yl-methyl-4-(beta-D-ribofuranosyl)aminobenzene 5'-phosphate synthase|nr:MAG: MBL fold metallo-hydrolase [Spirochaetae bacterium HGW-Spirochaetae-1]
MKVTVVCENTVGVPMPRGLIGEHGLSFLIEGETRTLFDTGQGMGVIKNLAIMGKDVKTLDRIILSHGHFDHVGGLADVLAAKGTSIPVYIHPEAFQKKIAHVELPGNALEIPIGFGLSREEYEGKGAQFKDVKGFMEIEKGLSAISEIARPAGWKTWDVRLKVKEGDAIKSDPFNDDLSLLLETDSGPVVLLGCAHAGMVEILQDLSNKSGHREFHAVIGGTHLETAPADYVEKAIQALSDFKVKVVATSHCTGYAPANKIATRFKEAFKPAAVGSVFDF